MAAPSRANMAAASTVTRVLRCIVTSSLVVITNCEARIDQPCTTHKGSHCALRNHPHGPHAGPGLWRAGAGLWRAGVGLWRAGAGLWRAGVGLWSAGAGMV